MHQHRLRHLPVLEGERIAGLLSSRDILAQMVEEDERTIRDLERDRMLIINPSAGNY